MFGSFTVQATTMPPTTPEPKADCQAQADIVFLLDASGSVGSTNFGKVKSFVHDLMTSFDIGSNAVQIGVDTFQTNHKAEFELNTYNTTRDVQAAINSITYAAGGTHTGEALKFVREHSFAAAQGMRFASCTTLSSCNSVVSLGQRNVYSGFFRKVVAFR